MGQADAHFESSPPGGGRFDEAGDATRRTRLANERTQLAWWRTGLTALAVALGVGRVIPELDPGAERWPYTLVGVGFALYAIALVAYGSRRGHEVEEAIARGGFISHQEKWIVLALTAGGVVLGAATLVLIILN